MNPKKLKKALAVKEKSEQDSVQVVKMRFKEDKFYKDQDVAHFEKGKVYEVKGADQIQRWLKRGGEIVEGQLEIPLVEVNPSVVVSPVEAEKPVVDEVDSEDYGIDFSEDKDE